MGTLLLAASLFGSTAPHALAASHREAPLISQDPTADATDFYSFVSPDRPDTVTFVANYIPFEEPAGGPNYYGFDPNVLYEINVDNNAVPTRHRTNFGYDKVRNQNTFLYNASPISSVSGAMCIKHTR